uniref:Uncharacterized protein n=1 Tax=Cyprinodon variegatus TaxID=28743 RepID=A0A3Q2FUN3_CYPVA
MRVHVHTKFCFLCVITFIFHHCNHCHVEGHDHASDLHQHSDLQISEAPYVRSTTVSPDSNSPEGPPLEEEQRYYIQQLFRRYGQKDRLDFQGFESLLHSLGLGSVQPDHKDPSSTPHQSPTNHSSDHHSHKEHRDEPALPSVTPTENPARTRKPGKVRGQGRSNKFPSTEAPPTDDHDHSGAHKDKRECLNLTQLLTYYGLQPDSVISKSEFTYLCPALLYQIDSRVCIRHYHQVDYLLLHNLLARLLPPLLSLLGVILVPILKQSCFKFLLTFLVALAVGTLSGDALLHLLPHVSPMDLKLLTSVSLMHHRTTKSHMCEKLPLREENIALQAQLGSHRGTIF